MGRVLNGAYIDFLSLEPRENRAQIYLMVRGLVKTGGFNVLFKI